MLNLGAIHIVFYLKTTITKEQKTLRVQVMGINKEN